MFKDQENPNFTAFDACGSLSNDQVFDPGRLGRYPDGTEMLKLFNPKDARKITFGQKSESV